MNLEIGRIMKIKNRKIRKILIVRAILLRLIPKPRLKTSISKYIDSEFVSYFRFAKGDFLKMLCALQLPEVIKL